MGLMLMTGVVVSACVIKEASTTQDSLDTCLAGSARNAADTVIASLVAKDGGKLAAFVHPKQGVRFSPSAYVNVASDVVLSQDQVRSLWTDPTIRRWGYAEGSGAPIEMSSAAYAKRYVLDRDFSHAMSVSINNDQAAGTTSNNAAEFYPQATRVEYVVDPSVSDPRRVNEWAALRLVLEKDRGCWVLIGIIHDAWSV